MNKYSDCPVGWKQSVFMVKRDLFPAGMGWKQSVGKDNDQEEDGDTPEVQKLVAVEGEDMSCLRTATLEQVGKWKRLGKGEAISKCSTGKSVYYWKKEKVNK